MSSPPDGEPISPEFKSEVVSKFCRDIASGAVTLTYVPADWTDHFREKFERDVFDALLPNVQLYVSTTVSGEKRAELTEWLFASIIVLRSNNIARDRLNQSKIEQSMETMDARFEAMRKLVMELLVVMREVLPKLEAIERKVDRL